MKTEKIKNIFGSAQGIFRRYILAALCLLYFCPSSVYAQKGLTVYGRVLTENKLPVMGAVVTVQESTANALTDELGYFVLDVPDGKSVLVVEADGFERFTTVAMREGDLEIILKEAPEGQGVYDRVFMPWMVTDKRSLTSSVSTITHNELRKSPTMRLDQALSGRLPGLMVVSGSAFPGDESVSYRIRGIRTLEEGGMNTMEKGGYGNPLIVVDGFEREFADFDASEIESFSVLKDAAATAIYGTRGANGVILVTTKRGQENKRTIDVEFSAGMVCPVFLPEFLPADQYAVLHNEARRNDGLEPLYDDTDIMKYRDGSDPIRYPNVDYYDEFVKNMTQQIKGVLSMSGGNRIVKYFVSLAYNHQGGLYDRINEDPEIETKLRYSKYNARVNLDVNIFRRLSASFNLAGRIEDRRYPVASGSTVFSMLSRYPSNAIPLEFTGIDPALNKEIHMLGGNSIYTDNPLGELSYSGNYENLKRYYQLGVQLHHDMDYITKGLRANLEFNADGYSYLLTYASRQYKVWEPVYKMDGTISSYKSYNTETTLSRSYYYPDITQWSGLNFNLTYNREFGIHKVDGLLMYRQNRTIYDQTNQPDKKMQDFVFRGTYSLKNRYFLEVTTNYSGTDNFYLTNTSRFFFPAVSASWIVSDEPWMKNDYLQLLKIRASWGITGNEEYLFTDTNGYKYRFPYRDRWWSQVQQHAWGASLTWVPNVVREGVMPNKDFTIEKSNMVNVGLDMKMLGNRLTFSGDFFYEKRSDIYTRGAGTLPLSLGVLEKNLPIMNNGQVNSMGFEISLGWQHKVGDFTYWANSYVDYSANKIINMDEPYKEDWYRRETGGRVCQNFGLVALGLFKNAEDVATSPQQMFGPYQAGDIKYADLNDDGFVDANDYTSIGGATFPNLGFALDLGFRYRNLDFSVLLQGASGMSHYLNNNAVRAFYNNGNISTYALNRYTDEASWATATYPRLTTEANENNWRISTFWLRDAAYLRVKNVELGYNIPQKAAKKLGMNGLRIYLNGYNLFTFDNIDGMDPEDPSAGISRYPQVRVLNIGLNLKF